MGNQRENNDELLFGLLSEKLYGHYCGTEEEQLSAEEEKAVINMMNSLQVEEMDDFDPTNSYKKFCEKYLLDEKVHVNEKKINTVEELLEEMEKDIDSIQVFGSYSSIGEMILVTVNRLRRMRTVRRLVFAVLAIVIMFCGMNVGTYATAKMGFFEFLSKSDRGWSFMVTGEGESVEMEEYVKNTYSSWEDVRKLSGVEGMLIPNLIPNGFELEEIKFLEGADKMTFTGKYYAEDEEKFQIVIEQYNEEMSWHFFGKMVGNDCVEEIIEERSVIWYQDEEDEISCFFTEGKYSYYIFGKIKKESIRDVIRSME